MANKTTSVPSLLDAVNDAASTLRLSGQCWYDRLLPPQQAELAELKAAFRDGKLKLPARAAGRVLSKIMRDRGICTVGERAVEEWLKKPD